MSRGPGESRPLTAEMLQATFEDLDARYREQQAERMAALRQLHELYDLEKAPGGCRCSCWVMTPRLSTAAWLSASTRNSSSACAHE